MAEILCKQNNQFGWMNESSINNQSLIQKYPNNTIGTVNAENISEGVFLSRMNSDIGWKQYQFNPLGSMDLLFCLVSNSTTRFNITTDFGHHNDKGMIVVNGEYMPINMYQNTYSHSGKDSIWIYGNMYHIEISNTFSGYIAEYGSSAHITNMSNMFNGCRNLTGSIPNFDTGNVTNMYSMFKDCTNLTGTIPNFNTTNVKLMTCMFYYCNNLTGSIPNFNTSNVISTHQMFCECRYLTGSIPNFNTSNVIGMGEMFYGCSNLTGSIPNFNTSSVVDMESMFASCYNLTGSIPNFNTSNVTEMYDMFKYCSKLTGSIPNWNINSICYMDDMFYYCTNLTGYNLFTGTWAEGKGTA